MLIGDGNISREKPKEMKKISDELITERGERSLRHQ